MDELTRAIAEALGCEQEPPGKGHRCEDYCRKHLTPWLICERRSSRVAAAIAPLIEARVREAQADAWDEGYAKGFYRAQTIHNDDPDRERDASEFDDPNPFYEEVRRG